MPCFVCAQLRGVKSVLRVVGMFVLGVFALLVFVVWKTEPRAREPFPPPLLPAGTTLGSLKTAEAHCYAHTIATLNGATQVTADAWARGLELPCTTDAKPCTAWSTEQRKDPFWKGAFREPQGLDSVDARLEGTTLVVDWGDYLCSGPN